MVVERNEKNSQEALELKRLNLGTRCLQPDDSVAAGTGAQSGQSRSASAELKAPSQHANVLLDSFVNADSTV